MKKGYKKSVQKIHSSTFIFPQIILKIQWIYVNYKNKHQQETGTILHVGTLENDATIPHVYVVVDNFFHAHITKFCWNLVTLQLNSLNLLENRYHKNWILPECQGVFFYKNGYVFVLMFGLFSFGPV